MKAVVTGGAGFIGSHLVDELIASGATVHVIDNLSTGLREHVNPKAILHVLDICSPETKELIVRVQPDVVFHLAAQVDVQRSIREPDYDVHVNIVGTVNMLEASCQVPVKKIVFASSCAVYGNLQTPLIEESDETEPISIYGTSKLTSESFIRLFHQIYGIPYTILRYANVYGPRQNAKGEGGVVAIFLDRIQKGLPLIIHGDGEQTRDFVFVKDVVTANLAAVHKGNQETIQVSTSARTSINRLVELLQNLHGTGIRVIHDEERPGDIRHSCLDHKKALRLLNWSPQYDISRGLKESFSHGKNK
jgi:UDP-glucose 4-epimerase